jgi:two-component SAPR family response regulator
MAGILYNNKSQKITIINKKSMIIYAPHIDDTTTVSFSGARPISKNKHFSTFNESTNQIISYNFRFLNSSPGKKHYSMLDTENMEWSAIDDEPNIQNNIYHRSFWNTKDSTFNTFAGRSKDTYSNDFKSFDFRTNTWTKIEMEGDFISPRIFTVVGQQKETNMLYVYGGYGNESGQQIEGSQVYTDLFLVDLSNKSIKKIMDFEEFQQDIVPFGNLIIGNTEGTIFYTLMGEKKTELNLRLFEINTLKKKITPVSDTLKMNRNTSKSFNYLFKDSLNQKLYHVFREYKDKNNGEVMVHSLNFPPSQLTKEFTPKKSGNRKFLLPLFGAILFVLGMFYFVRKQKIKLNKRKKNRVEYFRPNKNAILFLGGFQVFDSKGRDITYRFSKKLKELFVLIITETVQNKGISSKELSGKLWPGMNKTKQKNNQGYNIHAVRKILEDINGISLNRDGEKWKIECTGDCYFDFARVSYLIREENPAHKDKIISLFSYGNLLPFLQFEWLDKIKATYENDVISILLSICNDYFTHKNYLTCFETASIIHEKYDEINEEALRYKIISLDKMKGHSKSKNEFELFKRRYFATYQETYSLTIDELNKLT